VLTQKEASEKDLGCYSLDGHKYLDSLNDKLKALQEMSKGLADGTFVVPEDKPEPKKLVEQKPAPAALATEKKAEVKAVTAPVVEIKPIVPLVPTLVDKDTTTNDAFLKEFTADTSSTELTGKESKMTTVAAYDMQEEVEKVNHEFTQKLQDQQESEQKKLASLKDTNKQQLSEKQKDADKEVKALADKNNQSLEELKSKYTELNSAHDKEVKNLFENIGTLKFVKELRFFKGQWQSQKTEKKRKKIASAMANATKKWVGDGEKIE